MTASKSKKDRQREDDDSILEEIKQQSKNKNGSNYWLIKDRTSSDSLE
jgi:hypothetical protein